jgi:hypothetical protein
MGNWRGTPHSHPVHHAVTTDDDYIAQYTRDLHAQDHKHIDDADDNPRPGWRPRPIWKPAIGEGSGAANAARLETALARPKISRAVPTTIEMRAAAHRQTNQKSLIKNRPYAKAKTIADRERERERNHARYRARKAAGYYANRNRPGRRKSGKLTNHLVVS